MLLRNGLPTSMHQIWCQNWNSSPSFSAVNCETWARTTTFGSPSLNPFVWGLDMKALISDEDFIVHVLNNLLANYKVQISKLEKWFSSTTNPLTIQDMWNELNLKYTRLKQQSKAQKEVDQALAAFWQYKSKCTNCGKFGHKSAECQSKNSAKNKSGRERQKSKNAKNKEKGLDRSNKSHIKCFNCREMGHYQSKCPHNKLKKGSVRLTEKETNMVLMTVSNWRQSRVIHLQKFRGVYQVFLYVCDYFFATYPFCVVQKGVQPTGKCTCRNKCPGYKC